LEARVAVLTAPQGRYHGLINGKKCYGGRRRLSDGAPLSVPSTKGNSCRVSRGREKICVRRIYLRRLPRHRFDPFTLLEIGKGTPSDRIHDECDHHVAEQRRSSLAGSTVHSEARSNTYFTIIATGVDWLYEPDVAVTLTV